MKCLYEFVFRIALHNAGENARERFGKHSKYVLLASADYFSRAQIAV